jgi:SPP1 gp7 family putative phage head morphogenesis protein
MASQPLAELIADKFIGHSVDLLRLSANEQRTVVKMLSQLQRELETKIASSDVDERTIFQERKLTALWKTIDTLTTKYYSKIADTHRDSLADLSQIVSQQTVALTNAAVGVPLLTVGVPLGVLRAMADDAIVQGRPARDWWTRQSENLQTRLRQTIRQGVFAGDTLGDLLRRVRGTREKKFQDGIFSMSTRDASALIRTSVMSIANAARHETLQANDDVIDGQQWLSTLDPRTCVACMALSGQAWDSDGNPLGDTTADFPGPPPLHWACRCTLSALLKSWEQLAQDAKGDEKLGRKLDRIEKKIGKGTQASMGGPVPADFSYSDWLERRSEPEQQEILGQGKWQLWKDGKIGLTDLIDQSARPLTMKELSKRA